MRISALGLAIGLSCASATFAQIHPEPVLVTGQPAPAMPGLHIDPATTSFVFGEFDPRNGNLIVDAELLRGVGGVDFANNGATFVGRPGALRPLSREGTPVPNSGGLITARSVLPSLIGPVVNAIGPDWPLSGGFATFAISDDGTLTKLVAAGDPAPGIAGAQLAMRHVPPFDRPSMLVLQPGLSELASRITGPGVTADNDAVYWIGPPDELRLIAREGQPIPGLPDRTFGDRPRMVMNDSGLLSFAHGQDSTPERVAIVGTPDHFQIIARHGDPVPNTNFRLGNPNARASIGGKGYFVSGEMLDETGQTAGPGLFFLEHGSQLRPIFRAGSPAPDTTAVFGARRSGNTITWQQRSSSPRSGIPTSDGWGVVVAPLVGQGVTEENDVAHYAYSQQNTDDMPLHLLVREGDAAPLSGDVTFAHLDYNDARATTPAISRRGDFVFAAFLAGPDASTVNDESLWLRAADGAFTLLAREGDFLPVPGGTPRQIAHLIGNAHPLILSDDGAQLLFTAEFTDGTRGLYLVPIPEPTAAATLAFTLLPLLFRPRRPT